MKSFFQFMEDHFLGAIVVLMILSCILGILGTYLSMFFIAVIHLYEAASFGVGYG